MIIVQSLKEFPICKLFYCNLNFISVLDDTTSDWMIRHGRAAALSVVLKESPEIIWAEQYDVRTERTLLSQLAADNTAVTQTAVRSCGYLLQYLMNNELQLPLNLLGPFVKVFFAFNCNCPVNNNLYSILDDE